jgi:hypothetical protein
MVLPGLAWSEMFAEVVLSFVEMTNLNLTEIQITSANMPALNPEAQK